VVRLLKYVFFERDIIRHLALHSSLQFARWHVDEEATIEGDGRTIYVRTSSAGQEQRGPCDILRRAKAIRRDVVDKDIPRSFEKVCRHCESS
jgi:hypothetical protein